MTDETIDPIDEPPDDGPTIDEAKAAAPAFEPQPDAADLPENVPVGDPSAED